MQHETAESVWRAFSFQNRTYKIAKIEERKEEHRRFFENWLEKHKDSKKCSVITAEEYKEINQHLNGSYTRTKQCQHVIMAIESEG